MVCDKIFWGARSASQKILSRDNANEDLWQTNKHTDRQGWNSITPFLQSRGNIKHMQLGQKCLEIWLNCRDSFIYLYVDIHTSLKWRIALFLIPWMHLKRLIWKKKLKRKTKNSRYLHTHYQNHRKVKSINTNIISPMSSSKYWMNLYLMMIFICFDYTDSFLPPLHHSIFLSLQQNENILYSIIFILCE